MALPKVLIDLFIALSISHISDNEPDPLLCDSKDLADFSAPFSFDFLS